MHRHSRPQYKPGHPSIGDYVMPSSILHLLDVVKISDEEISKWLTKAKVESWEEMDSAMGEKVINFLKAKVTTTETK